MIDYGTVVSASEGDALAAQAVLKHFEAYIDALCTHSYTDSLGRCWRGVDVPMRSQVQGRLLQAMLAFDATR